MPWEEQENDLKEPSRSALKRAAKAVEELAERLAGLSAQQLSRLSPPEEVAAELRVVAKAAGHGARKRQIKHLAGLLRRDDEWTDRLREFLDGSDIRHYREQELFHRLETLRDRLCGPETFSAALEETESLFPAIDREQISRLAAAVQAGGDKHAFREIFQLLRKASETPQTAP